MRIIKTYHSDCRKPRYEPTYEPRYDPKKPRYEPKKQSIRIYIDEKLAVRKLWHVEQHHHINSKQN